MSVAYRAPESDPVAEADLATHAGLKRSVHGIPASVGSGQGLVGDGSGGWSAANLQLLDVAQTRTKALTITPDSAVTGLTLNANTTTAALIVRQNGSGLLTQMLDSNGDELTKLQDIATAAGANAPVFVLRGRTGGNPGGSWEFGLDLGGLAYNIVSRVDWPTAGNVHDVVFVNQGGGGAPNGDTPRIGIGAQSQYQFTVRTDPLGRDLALGGINLIHSHDQTGYAFNIEGVGAATPTFRVQHDVNNNPTITMKDSVLTVEPLTAKNLKLAETILTAYGANASARTFVARITGETADRMRVKGDGTLLQGNGAGTLDIAYERTGTSDMHITIAGTEKFRLNANGPGFNGTTPPGKPTLAVAATDLASVITLANDIRTRLINYGLAA